METLFHFGGKTVSVLARDIVSLWRPGKTVRARDIVSQRMGKLLELETLFRFGWKNCRS